MTNPADLSSLDWLDDVPPNLVPDGYAAALEAERTATAYRDRLQAEQARLEAQLAQDWATAPDPLLHLDAGVQFAAIQQLWQRLPEVPRVPDEWHERIAADLVRGLALPHLTPPIVAAELAHHVAAHPREMPPTITPAEEQMIQVTEQVSARITEAHRALAVLREPLQGGSLAGRVRAVSEYRETTLEPLLAAVGRLAEVVAEQDATRIADGRAHSCPLLGGSHVVLEPVAPSARPWTLAAQMRGDGRPPIAASRFAVTA